MLFRNVGLLAVVTVFGLQAQGIRCDLVSKDTLIGGQPRKQCLDIDVLRGTTVTIPSNVTRLDNDGFALCRKAVVQGGNADVVFILDQSGSMFADRAWVNTGVNPNDTVYFFQSGGTGCNYTSTTGNVIVPVIEQPRTIPRLTNGTGCNQYSGDPLNARAAAVRQAIDYVASNSPNSTAGWLGFGSNVGTARRPLQLNSTTNVNTVKNNLTIANLSGTTYRYPLDSARKWLNDATLRKNSKAAIVFISDGANTGPAYLDLVNSTMPPIYGIFLGKNATPDTANLVQLASLTGGAYYRVPPGKPDSLASVVRIILDRILQNYDPDQVTVTNSSLAPPQTSLANDPEQFLDQNNGSWVLLLDSAIALQSGSNVIRVIARFREAATGNIRADTSQFTLSVTGPVVPGTSTVFSGVVTQCYNPSELRWLNTLGVRPGYFTDADSSVKIQIRSTNIAQFSALARLSTRRTTGRVPDAENATLGWIFSSSDSSRFIGNFTVRAASTPTLNSGVLEPYFTDSLIASWVNPRDARDFARDTILFRPINKAARAYFSTRSDGGDTVSTFDPTATQACLILEDNRKSLTDSLYRVSISDSVDGSDHETFQLNEISPGKFSACFPIEVGTKVNNNGRLQFSPSGDQMRAVYVDPIPEYRDSAIAAAGIGVSVQEQATLVFTDANGVVLPANSFWPLDRGRVYLRFTDDNSLPRIGAKTVQITARSIRLRQLLAQDVESVALTDTVSQTRTLKAWRGGVNILESLVPINGDGTLQGAYRIELTATVAAHDNAGQPTGQNATASLIVAHPDSAMSFSFADTANSANADGASTVYLTIRDQDFVRNAQDTIVVTAQCPSSGDSVTGLRLVQVSPGVYASEPLFRNGLAANTTDRILSCPAGAGTVISYTDPVYYTIAAPIIRETQPPAALPTGTSFVSQITVGLATATAGARINYTLDGSMPQPSLPLVYTDSITMYSTTVLKAVASTTGYLRSRILTETYTRTPFPSRLQILDVNGNPFPNRTVTDAVGGLRVLLNTSQGGLGGVTVVIRSRRGADVENPVLINTTFDNQTHDYWNNLVLRAGAPTVRAGNDTLETPLPDTLVAVWRNPLDTNEVVADTLFVAPGFSVSNVFFSNSLGGSKVDSFPAGTTTVYVVDSTRSLTGFVYRVAVSSSIGGSDLETYVLNEVRPGVFSVAVPVQPGGVKVSGNGTLQVSAAGDQLLATFIHPVYGDTSYGVAGYNQAPQRIALLRFLDTLGVPLAPSSFYSPANGRIRIRYEDDWTPGIDPQVHQKSLRLVLNAMRGGQRFAVDSEVAILSYVQASGAWEGTTPLRDRSLRVLNDTVESQFRGELQGFVASHNNAGAADGNTETAGLLIAYPDQSADVTLTDTRGNSVGRLTDSITFSLKDQAFTLLPGAPVSVRLSCQNSGDIEDPIWLPGDGLGNYVLPIPVRKEEGAAAAGDGRLQCLASDVILVDYTDPVYGTKANASATWGSPGFVKIRFASEVDTSTIVSISDTVPRFLAMVETPSPDRNKIDTFWVRLTTAQGELDSVPAVETGANSGVFKAFIPFQFTLAAPVPGDRNIEGQLNVTATTTSVPLTGMVRRGVDSGQAVITLFAQFNPPRLGYVQDRNGDGRADWVSLSFAKPLTRGLAVLDSVYWNSEIPANRRSAIADIASGGAGVTLDVSSAPFPKYLTGLPRIGKPPVAKLPFDAYFRGVPVLLADSVGPVPQVAIKHPSDLTTYLVGDEVRYQPDTLVISVSEPLMLQNWNGVFRFRGGVNCEDPSAHLQTQPVMGFGEPRSTDGMNFVVPLDNRPGAGAPQIGDCIFLENDGRFTDTSGNLPSILGAVLVGTGSEKAIRGMLGYPPVSGINPGDRAYQLANNSDPSSRGRLQQDAGGRLKWIPPVESGQDNGAGYVPMPDGISAVEVFATERFTARVHIFDQLGNPVKAWTEKFGYNGEFSNANRRSQNGARAYLQWDQRDSKGQLVGTGVYVWKVIFTLDDGRTEILMTRTGLIRR